MDTIFKFGEYKCKLDRGCLNHIACRHCSYYDCKCHHGNCKCLGTTAFTPSS
ncbi:defensin-like protein 286 [Capsella rubella]|uniref:defensin-like protein 286 n=1 Tax=Capsella rubella TaxID=81985 RepID=UPI000CD49BB2|nr:defensin-like protein 286 [Capsella rubella]